MPRESIITEAARRQRADSGSERQEEITIGWDNDADSGAVVRIGKIIRDFDAVGLNARPEDLGTFAELDRRALNRMIRLLRHARDRAFGSDE